MLYAIAGGAETVPILKSKRADNQVDHANADDDPAGDALGIAAAHGNHSAEDHHHDSNERCRDK